MCSTSCLLALLQGFGFGFVADRSETPGGAVELAGDLVLDVGVQRRIGTGDQLGEHGHQGGGPAADQPAVALVVVGGVTQLDEAPQSLQGVTAEPRAVAVPVIFLAEHRQGSFLRASADAHAASMPGSGSPSGSGSSSSPPRSSARCACREGSMIRSAAFSAADADWT